VIILKNPRNLTVSAFNFQNNTILFVFEEWKEIN
jgi:hypothetical protein